MVNYKRSKRLARSNRRKLSLRQGCAAERLERRNWDMRTLKDVKVGESAIVRRLNGEGAVKRRIMDMGITKGVEIYVRKLAPLGDPMELTVRGYELSLRKADAEMIEIEAPEPL